MAKRITLGGNRLGAGGKMTEKLHGYGKSKHDLGHVFKSSMTTGTLVPFFVELMTNGDHCTIDLNSLVRTYPTIGAMFGSFKMQMDVFKIPIRYYIAELHNNKKGVGLEMNKIMFPKMTLSARNPDLTQPSLNQQQIDPASLLHYLGIKGLGKGSLGPGEQDRVIRAFNAIPLLGYWDIYANYYANLQEGIGVVIAPNGLAEQVATVTSLTRGGSGETGIGGEDISFLLNSGITAFEIQEPSWSFINLFGTGLTPANVTCRLFPRNGGDVSAIITKTVAEIMANQETYGIRVSILANNTRMAFSYPGNAGTAPYLFAGYQQPMFTVANQAVTLSRDIALQTFDIKNIDKMREAILANTPGVAFEVTNQNYLPYAATTAVIPNIDGTFGDSVSKSIMAGLGIKTYQSDRFNNWLSEEYINGANGVTELSSIDVSDGTLTMDSLNLQQKLYNMLNRIVLSGGSYRDWQEAVYAHRGTGELEVPEYVGGASCEIMFNEVISTNSVQAGNVAEQNALGALGGRGAQQNLKKNKIHITANEPMFIMGIVSFTPRLDYSQGNDWKTQLETMDDLHKPEMDGIGFQDLLTDEFAAWDTVVDAETQEVKKKSAGKQLAWTEYTTRVNEVHANFTNEGTEAFMVLNRSYDPDENGNISDLTTYIDPVKYNKPFAYQNLSAQPFWVQIGIDMWMSRVMASTQIPQL